MFRMRPITRFAAAALAVAIFSISILADTVRLKDGSIIKGTITGFTGGKFTIEIGSGSRKRQLTFDAAEVESIEFEPIVRSAARQPAITDTARNVPRYEPVVTERIPPTQDQTPEPKTPTPETVETVEPRPPNTSGAKPIELGIKVLADNTSNGWTNTGWVVKKGQKIRISGTGEVSLGKGKTSTPGGLWDVEDEAKLLKAVPTGALIAVIGDDNNEFIYIGNDREFTASRDGALFLGVNEGNLNDNTGNYDVKIEIFPGS